MLAPMGEDGSLGIGEGLETALAGTTIFDVPTWSGVSASGVANFGKDGFPAGLKKLFVFADHGEAGKKAAEAVHCRATKANIKPIIVWPKSDDDFAEDLKQGYCAADYELGRDEQDNPQPEPSPEPE